MLSAVEFRGHFHLQWGRHRVRVMEELPGVTLESCQTLTRGDAQDGNEGCSRKGEQCVKRHRGEKGWGSRLDPSLAGPQVPGTRRGLDPKAVEAMDGPEHSKGMEGTVGSWGPARACGCCPAEGQSLLPRLRWG